MNNTILEVKNLSFSYDKKTYVLNDINFLIKRNETLVILGQSGCGKTTLFKNLIGLQIPQKGEVIAYNKLLDFTNKKTTSDYYRKIGVLFQSGALLNSLSIYENLKLPLDELTDIDDDLKNIIIDLKLKWVGLNKVKYKMPSELSGGMRKRAALARAIILDPDILYFDEPHSGLDPVITFEINKLITQIKKAFNLTMVVITHDIHSALCLADKIIIIKDGEILYFGDPTNLKEKQKDHPYINKFLSLAEKCQKLD